MNNLELKNIFDLTKYYDVILLDIWGVIIEGNTIYPGVVEAINKLCNEKNVMFVSNSPRPKGVLYKMIESWGIVESSVEKVFCSGEEARKLLEKIDNPVIYHLGNDRNHDILLNTNYVLTEDLNKANVLLITVYRDEGEDIEEFDRLLKDAANLQLKIICANPDIIVPNEGKTRYAPGYFAKKIEDAGGKVIYTGKPHIAIYEAVFEKIPSIAKNRILMIGDSFETDILGAQNAGIHSALVLTGNCSLHHKTYDSISEKLNAISNKAKSLNLNLNYVTEIKI